MAKLLIRSLLIPSMGLVGRLENESTDHIQGIAPVPLRVRPEPRRPGWDYAVPFSLTVYSGFSIAPRASVEHLDPYLHCSGI